MHLGFSSTRGHFTQTFDELAALPRPRRAVWAFLGLTALVGLLFIFGMAVAAEFAGKFGIFLSNMLSFNASGILSKPTFWGVLAVFVIGYVWLCAMRAVRKFAGWLGGEADVVDP